MAQLSDYAKNDLFFQVTGLRLENYQMNENVTTDRSEIYKLIDNVVSIYEEKLRWIPIEEKMPEPRKDISLKLDNLTMSEITGFLGYSEKFYIKLTDIIDCDNVKLNCKVTHWRSFL